MKGKDVKKARKDRASATEAEMLETLADAIVSWEGMESGGKPFDCTPENIDLALQSPDFFEQVYEAASDRTLFMSA